MPLPVEIRDITGYNPTMAVAIEGNVTKWFDQEKKWGMRIGIRLDSKGMKTNAKVKNYGMEIIGEGGDRICEDECKEYISVFSGFGYSSV